MHWYWTYTVAGVNVFKKKEEQSVDADDDLEMTARRQLSLAHVGLTVQAAYPKKATKKAKSA
jgi:hypothetical protein